MDAIDAVGVLADQHVQALLLADRGLDEAGIAARLRIERAAVPSLLVIARQKLAELGASEVGEAPDDGSTGADR